MGELGLILPPLLSYSRVIFGFDLLKRYVTINLSLRRKVSNGCYACV